MIPEERWRKHNIQLDRKDEENITSSSVEDTNGKMVLFYKASRLIV